MDKEAACTVLDSKGRVGESHEAELGCSLIGHLIIAEVVDFRTWLDLCIIKHTAHFVLVGTHTYSQSLAIESAVLDVVLAPIVQVEVLFGIKLQVVPLGGVNRQGCSEESVLGSLDVGYVLVALLLREYRQAVVARGISNHLGQGCSCLF